MSRIIPIPSTRVGDLFVRQRLVGQTQLDQLSLFQLQTQISTGQRLQLPSDDAPAALRAINVQRLLDRKGQIQSNLQASNQYLSAAEERLSHISTLLSDLRGEVVGVSGTVVPDSARQALVQEIDGVLRELVSAGNAKYQGRYLFAGSQSQNQPYDFNKDFVEFFGNEGVLRSYVDLEQLFATNLSGTQVFGGTSAALEGSVDLNPQLTASTLIGSLNGGSGISGNPAISVSVNTGIATMTSVVDLSSAVTIGDVARLIERGAPAGTNIRVDVTGDGLRLNSASGPITVGEVNQGRTARALGILSAPNTPPSGTLVGANLNPAVLKTTKLADLLGTKAQGIIQQPGNPNNDILLTAGINGSAFDGVTVEFQVGGVKGSETVTYDANSKILTVQVAAGASTASDVAAAITAEGTFTAVADYHDSLTTAQIGTAPVELGSYGPLTTGGSGEALDTTSGLVLTNGGQSVTLDISEAETVEDFLNLINGAGLGFKAEINAAKNGINVRSRLSGADFTIGENGGTTATQLGIRTYTGSTELAGLNRGLGVETTSNPANDDFTITARDGTQLAVNVSGAATVDEVIVLINTNPANGGVIEARLANNGNGIELVDSSVGAGSLTVQHVEGSRAAEFLGFIPAGQSEVTSTATDGSGNALLQSEDRHTLEADSVFNTLLRLKTALQQNDETEIGRTLERLDVDLERVTFARAELGARLQNLEVIGVRLQDEHVQLQSALSQDLEVDLVEAISNLTARQFAFEASLRTSASLLQMSLLNFL